MGKFPNLIDPNLIPISVFFEKFISLGFKLGSAKRGNVPNFFPSYGYKTSIEASIPIPCIFTRSDLPISQGMISDSYKPMRELIKKGLQEAYSYSPRTVRLLPHQLSGKSSFIGLRIIFNALTI